MRGGLHSGGAREPAVFRCLVDAAVPVRPLAVGVREAFAARDPGHGREVGDRLRSYCATAGYLSFVAGEGR